MIQALRHKKILVIRNEVFNQWKVIYLKGIINNKIKVTIYMKRPFYIKNIFFKTKSK